MEDVNVFTTTIINTEDIDVDIDMDVSEKVKRTEKWEDCSATLPPMKKFKYLYDDYLSPQSYSTSSDSKFGKFFYRYYFLLQFRWFYFKIVYLFFSRIDEYGSSTDNSRRKRGYDNVPYRVFDV